MGYTAAVRKSQIVTTAAVSISPAISSYSDVFSRSASHSFLGAKLIFFDLVGEYELSTPALVFDSSASVHRMRDGLTDVWKK